MNKKIVSLFICLSLLALQARVQAESNLLIGSTAMMLGGIAVCAISAISFSYPPLSIFDKERYQQKVELLQKIQEYCEQNTIDTNDLSSDDIVSFVKELKKERLLQEIIKNNETKTTLTRTLFWHKLLLYGGIAAAATGFAGHVGWRITQFLDPFFNISPPHNGDTWYTRQKEFDQRLMENN